MIVDGTLAQGARIPGERQLAVSMGVSRASVRSALRDLELKGLIDRRPGRGTIITDTSARQRDAGSLLGSLDADERNLLEVMDLRATIEPPIAARAAIRATAADIRRLRTIHARAEEVTAVVRIVRLDKDFHRQISRATHNPLLEQLLETTRAWMGPSPSMGLQSRRRVRASAAGHREVVEAIAARDPDRAHAAMASHIQQVNAVLADIAGLPGNVGPARVSRRAGGRAHTEDLGQAVGVGGNALPRRAVVRDHPNDVRDRRQVLGERCGGANGAAALSSAPLSTRFSMWAPPPLATRARERAP